jgi:predicted RNase H-like nuclease
LIGFSRRRASSTARCRNSDSCGAGIQTPLPGKCPLIRRAGRGLKLRRQAFIDQPVFADTVGSAQAEVFPDPASATVFVDPGQRR